ncbi:transcriptional repressor DicA [Sphingomonas dokdonensis]|uniref:Transcriptional repressor DicA n=2 Tax=Sphingomonas dokdonensis TaxID=344880 RepID=A0A245ZCZ4_9SPHN|nr:transcriptional repressor DicA [Sphingomonas dokdonensis]
MHTTYNHGCNSVNRHSPLQRKNFGCRLPLMVDGQRLSSRMQSLGLSQSELARRVGVAQQTIYKLITGASRSSSHLHRIARELNTTPAFLTGETDDPDQSAPPEPELSHDELTLVRCIREIEAPDREALLHLARSLPRADRSAALAKSWTEVLPPERALAQMFEGLLMAMDRQLPLAEQGALLARRLPIGLSQLVDLLPAGSVPADTKPRRSRPTPVPAPQ